MTLALPGQSESALSSKRWLADFLGLSGGVTALTACEQVEAAIRQAEMKTHPDRGGDKQNFYKVQQARELLLNWTFHFVRLRSTMRSKTAEPNGVI